MIGADVRLRVRHRGWERRWVRRFADEYAGEIERLGALAALGIVKVGEAALRIPDAVGFWCAMSARYSIATCRIRHCPAPATPRNH